MLIKKTEDELLKEQPQIFEFIRTTFTCITIGYYENNQVFYQIAPQPPKLHSFISHISKDFMEIFFKTNSFLHVLIGSSNHIENMDELLLAYLKHLNDHKIMNLKYIETFIRDFANLIDNDYRKLKNIAERIQNIVEKV